MRRMQTTRSGRALATIVLAVVIGIVCLTSAGCVQILRIVGAGDGGVVRGIGNSGEPPVASVEVSARRTSPW
jgi:hypothetical protein